jgi:hypothetical protein
VASRSGTRRDQLSARDIGELIDDLEKRMDRCKVLFEQYFLGIQKLPPMTLQKELERRIRELTQTHIANTGLRFRFTTLSQKFGSYNTYWKRTMRQIENGTYVRDMARMGRRAARTGADIPDEVLAKMPKRMREKILRDREALAKRQAREEAREEARRSSGKVRDNKPGNVHTLDESDLDDFDLDSIFSAMTGGGDAQASPASSASTRDDPGSEVDSLFDNITSATAESAPPSAPPKAPRPPASPPRRPVAAKPPPRPPATRRTPAPPGVKPPPGMSAADGQALFKRYKKAQELIGKKTDGLTYDKLMRSLNKQAPKIMDQHRAKGVSFNVVVKGDRVVLKATPKKE